MLKSFASAAWLLEQEKREIVAQNIYLNNNNFVLSKIDHLIDRCIRTSSNLVIPNASKEALVLARRLNINLFAAKEGDKANMKRFCEEKNELDSFWYEHKETVYELRGKIALSNSSEDVLGVFYSQEVVWVLNSENERLKKNGHNHIRPNSSAAYAMAGIEVVNSSYVDYQVWRDARWLNR